MTRRFDFTPLPPFSESSKNWISHLLSTVQDLASRCGMSMHEALQLPVSFEAYFYASDAWEKKKAEIEAEAQKHNAFIKMGNEIIKAMSNSGRKKR